MNIDTRYVTGDLAKDIQFLKDNLTMEDADMFRAQVQFIMSVGNDTIKPKEQEKPE
jgi:hypothetical protein